VNFWVLSRPESGFPEVLVVSDQSLVTRVRSGRHPSLVPTCTVDGERFFSRWLVPDGSLVRLPSWRDGNRLWYVSPLGVAVSFGDFSAVHTLVVTRDGLDDLEYHLVEREDVARIDQELSAEFGIVPMFQLRQEIACPPELPVDPVWMENGPVDPDGS